MTTLYNIIRTRSILIVSMIFLSGLSCRIYGSEDNLVLLKSLEGKWLFSIGKNEEWTLPQFNDSNWESVNVPSPWENEGFNGYNGYGFYRKNFNIPSAYKGRMLYLNMGYIDDVDEVYFNGHKIGSTGSFPPDYNTAYNAERIYFVPEEYISFDGNNLIAVKVYDSVQDGGIVSGNIGLYGGKASVSMEVNLQSNWKFQPGDDIRRKENDFDDSGWSDIMVPAKWEDQGYRDYDGYAWYRKSFIYKSLANDKLVILMGKIDDVDQVYINGIFVGSTGNFPRDDDPQTGQEFTAFRGYYIPDGLLKKNQKNVIAVRVFDSGGEGGIYEGPVGIITQTKYIEYWRKNKRQGD
jgi:hypothetical protein